MFSAQAFQRFATGFDVECHGFVLASIIG
jgi:hypothetical protein